MVRRRREVHAAWSPRYPLDVLKDLLCIAVQMFPQWVDNFHQIWRVTDGMTHNVRIGHPEMDGNEDSSHAFLVEFDIRLENELQGARVLLFDAIEMVNMSSTSSSSEGPVFLGPKCLYFSEDSSCFCPLVKFLPELPFILATLTYFF